VWADIALQLALEKFMVPVRFAEARGQNPALQFKLFDHLHADVAPREKARISSRLFSAVRATRWRTHC